MVTDQGVHEWRYRGTHGISCRHPICDLHLSVLECVPNNPVDCVGSASDLPTSPSKSPRRSDDEREKGRIGGLLNNSFKHQHAGASNRLAAYSLSTSDESATHRARSISYRDTSLASHQRVVIYLTHVVCSSLEMQRLRFFPAVNVQRRSADVQQDGLPRTRSPIPEPDIDCLCQ